MRDNFSSRHIGPSENELASMLKLVGANSLDDLIQSAIPKSILLKKPLDLGAGLSEPEFLNHAKKVANQNFVFKSFIGQGYYNTHTPTVILRNILENPGWYTAYTPYQAEISQGRMEALLNFQTMVGDLTGLPLANASLLDEATAAAEAMALSFHSQKKNKRKKLLVDVSIYTQTLDVLRTRAEPIGVDIIVADVLHYDLDDTFFAAFVQYPNSWGEVCDYKKLSSKLKSIDGHLLVAADILSLCVLEPPGEWGADIVVGSTQRFGVPMGFGGPHAAYMAVQEEFTRLLPGRIIGLSKDVNGGAALRLALQTREQHIRREKATSNICTSQVLLAVMASMYAVYHGPEGLRNIALRTHNMANSLVEGLKKLGVTVRNQNFFDSITVLFEQPQTVEHILLEFSKKQVNLGRISNLEILIACDELTTFDDVTQILGLFAKALNKESSAFTPSDKPSETLKKWGRKSKYLEHHVFNSHHSETELLRYIHKLEQKDLALNQSMIPLGSCTMKLNATTEMIPVTWPEFANIHPFAPAEQTKGYQTLFHHLENALCQITGFSAISLQPNAGSQGEYAGLLVIREYQKSKGQQNRTICLIPTSAHGTNPASAVMAGLKVVPVQCDSNGNVDVEDLRRKSTEHSAQLAALMITYPSTHGVFEDSIREICDIVHSHGGQVYMDGANFNALVGVSRPGDFGPDVCHLNLHKTFCIPHGGGGPGVGPIGVATHLKPYLPTHSYRPECGGQKGVSAIAAAPWGSASILPISWAYILMMGSEGLKRATQMAILNANYIAKRLSPEFNVLYKGHGGWVAHECIIDVRDFKSSADVTVDDIAKRLMDFGFHAPTMSWPVAGTLMIEPTESESKAEMDRFCDALLQIREEIRAIENGKADKTNNVLKNAPHSLTHMTANTWDHPYTREQAAYPLTWVRDHKFWPPVSRVDNVFGDRNLVCSCPPWVPDQDVPGPVPGDTAKK